MNRKSSSRTHATQRFMSARPPTTRLPGIYTFFFFSTPWTDFFPVQAEFEKQHACDHGIKSALFQSAFIKPIVSFHAGGNQRRARKWQLILGCPANQSRCFILINRPDKQPNYLFVWTWRTKMAEVVLSRLLWFSLLSTVSYAGKCGSLDNKLQEL